MHVAPSENRELYKELFFSGSILIFTLTAITIISLGLSSAQGTHFDATWIQDMGKFMTVYWPLAVVSLAGGFVPATLVAMIMFKPPAETLYHRL